MIKIAPSVLAADFGHMAEAVRMLGEWEADMVHLDVMDGTFVPPITFGTQMVEAIRQDTTLYLDAHLMIVNPEKHIASFAKAGADNITVHAETVEDLPATIKAIKAYGIDASVSIKPNTPVSAIASVLDEVSMVLVMTVEPGYGGQSLIPETVEKVRELRQIFNDKGLDTDIQVDGGVNLSTIDTVLEAGANVIVAGSAVFKAENPAEVIKRLRGQV